ncbi:MAG: hypothetical protein FWE24_09070, partial [Defluviitaleaceae bacterium]|nr:hypothetical protein [Defluviitaleaceae bacterium]
MNNYLKRIISTFIVTIMLMGLLPVQAVSAFAGIAPLDGSLPVLINDGEPIIAAPGEILRIAAYGL